MAHSGALTPFAAASDATLVARTHAHDQGAFSTLYDRYSGIVYSVALRVVREPASAEDILHEIFMQLWRKPEQFESARGSLGAWLAVITRNRAIDFLRRQKPQDDPEEVYLASPVDLQTEVERNTAIEKVQQVLQSMPDAQRKAVEMAFFEGLTHTDIAAKTGEPLGTIKSRIRSALLAVRKAFE
jgi:RNA polymerase sigma-70 factor (ECF subfamily)